MYLFGACILQTSPTHTDLYSTWPAHSLQQCSYQEQGLNPQPCDYRRRTLLFSCALVNIVSLIVLLSLSCICQYNNVLLMTTR